MDDYLEEALSPSAISKEIQDEKRRWIIAVTADEAIGGYAELNWGSSEPCITHPKAIELQRLYVAIDMHGKVRLHLLLESLCSKTSRVSLNCSQRK